MRTKTTCAHCGSVSELAAARAIIRKMTVTVVELRKALQSAVPEIERLRDELLTAAALHKDDCEVRRWADKSHFGPPAQCSCEDET